MNLVNLILEQSDAEIKRRVVKGFKLMPAAEGFDEPYILKTGKHPDPHMANRINKWIKVNFPFSNVVFKYERGYRTVNYILPNNNQSSLFEENNESNERKPLNFFDLVSKRIVWVTEPHTNGKRDKQNWEHDTNIITLWNVEHPEPGQEWVRQAIHFPKNNSVKWWNDVGQFELSDEKYNQILKSIELYKKKNEKDKDLKILTCRNCRSKFSQTTHKKKKSLPICPICGTHNK